MDVPFNDAVVWLFFWIHVGVILVVTAYFAVVGAVLPNVTERGAARFGRRPWLASLIGLLVSVPWMVVAILLLQAGQGIAGIGVILSGAWIFAALIGGSAIALHVGRGREGHTEFRSWIRGGLLLSLTWALPLVGWFFVLPLTLATGVGCLLLGMLPMKTPGAQVGAPPVIHPPARPDSDLAFSSPQLSETGV